MNQPSLSLLGLGNMGSILLRALISLPFTSPNKIWVFDPDPQCMKRAEKYKVQLSSDVKQAVQNKDFIIIAVKPQNMAALLAAVKDSIPPDSVVISIAAGISIAKIQSYLGEQQKVVRAMPNTPALIKTGITALAFGEHLSAEEKAKVRRMFNRVGKTLVVSEDMMDAVTGLSGSGPAYVFAFVEALVEGGVKMGLPEGKAYKMVTQTLFGSVKMLIKIKLSPSEQIQKVTSPGGTTIAGLAIMEKGKFKETVIAAVEAATRRSAELGRNE